MGRAKKRDVIFFFLSFFSAPLARSPALSSPCHCPCQCTESSTSCRRRLPPMAHGDGDDHGDDHGDDDADADAAAAGGRGEPQAEQRGNSAADTRTVALTHSHSHRHGRARLCDCRCQNSGAKSGATRRDGSGPRQQVGVCVGEGQWGAAGGSPEWPLAAGRRSPLRPAAAAPLDGHSAVGRRRRRCSSAAACHCLATAVAV